MRRKCEVGVGSERGRGVRGENGIHRVRERYCRGTVWREG